MYLNYIDVQDLRILLHFCCLNLRIFPATISMAEKHTLQVVLFFGCMPARLLKLFTDNLHFFILGWVKHKYISSDRNTLWQNKLQGNLWYFSSRENHGFLIIQTPHVLIQKRPQCSRVYQIDHNTEKHLLQNRKTDHQWNLLTKN